MLKEIRGGNRRGETRGRFRKTNGCTTKPMRTLLALNSVQLTCCTQPAELNLIAFRCPKTERHRHIFWQQC